MATHPDAIGYLMDLAREENEPWFQMLCDLAIASGAQTLDNSTLQTLYAVYLRKEKYNPTNPAPTAPQPTAGATQVDLLTQLSGFKNFKLLCDTLTVNFTKRITLIFGTNSSGKSSLCESLKALATPEQPDRPLENLRATMPGPPEFRYKFASNASEQIWTPALGYGVRQASIKYFDTSIAISNVKNPVDARRIVVLTPFRLNVFDLVKTLTVEFRETLQRLRDKNSEELGKSLEAIRIKFTAFKTSSLALIDETTVTVLPHEIKRGEEFKNQAQLKEKETHAEELQKATSDEGLKMLRAEHLELETFLATLDSLLQSAAELWELQPAKKKAELAKMLVLREEIASALIPERGTLESLIALLRAALQLCTMEEAAGLPCPLCRRELGLPEVELFKQYQELLSGELESSIMTLTNDIANATNLKDTIDAIDRDSWEKYATIDPSVLTAAKRSSDIIVAGCDLSAAPTEEAKAELDSLRASATALGKSLDSKKSAIDAAASGRAELLRKLGELNSEIEPLRYAQAIADFLDKLKDAKSQADEAWFWSQKLPAFSPLLKKVTERAKLAHQELVATGFKNRLDKEYVALAEKDMAAFGVKLAPKGVEASVTMIPQIGGRNIERVLCEGEQRLHALALFFAELETSNRGVVVFDDPVSSFDYNYIENYCIRLREYAKKHPSSQIIVLTHNWEFFVQLQTKFNQACMDSQLSVQVLENCAVVADYSEKTDVLKNEINDLLSMPSEPTSKQKEDLAGKMRRLIEAIVNTHVFCNQRHQFKQKSLQSSVFREFTKIVALLPQEATDLGDLYSKLSPAEHYDPRNAFINTDKAMFQTRYRQILAIEAAVEGRKP